MSVSSRFLGTVILVLAGILGLGVLLQPLLDPATTVPQVADRGAARAAEALGLLLAILGLCLVVIVAQLETRRLDARLVALLGVLVALNATLRLVSGPAGSTAVFLLPILCGAVFGADFGFLLGALSILASAILTGGVGPWLPFQMLATGWSGMVAGWLPRFRSRPLRFGTLAAWGAAVGILYGLVVNLWFWPFLAPETIPAGTGYEPGSPVPGALARYGVFYVTTSLWWDLPRSIGNVVLILLAGPPAARLLERFRRRFSFDVESEPPQPVIQPKSPAGETT